MRIALCDNDPEFLSGLKEMIREYGAVKNLEVRTDLYSRGEDLLAQPRDRYDIIFMDVY